GRQARRPRAAGPRPRPGRGPPGRTTSSPRPPRLYSGSSPEGDEGFRSLQQFGINTVISVDGARPDVERARKHGLRYVHLPIGYDRVTQDQALRLARAARDLAGPVYIHCHHGKHRSPAAAAVVLLCLDGQCPVEAAVRVMKQAGTDPHYRGLYASPAALRRPTKADLDRAPADFPEVAKVTALATLMVGIEQRWDHLKLVRAAGWKAPKGHPDIDPPHEALQLWEQYRESGRLPEAGKKHADCRRRLADATAVARELEQVLRRGKASGKLDEAAAEALFKRAAAACADCHARHRDVPR